MRSVLALVILAVLGTACTTTGKSYIPVDSPLHPWQAADNDTPAAATTPQPAAAPPAAPEKGEKKGKK